LVRQNYKVHIVNYIEPIFYY